MHRSLYFALAMTIAASCAQAQPQNLKPVVESSGSSLQFDWPMLKIGVGEYAEGPTGVTVFKFGRKVLGAVDVRGGAPGTVNGVTELEASEAAPAPAALWATTEKV